LLGVLPPPRDALPWLSNTDTVLVLDAFVHGLYARASWAREEKLYREHGFQEGVIEGWNNPDRSQQSIVVARFATAAGAQSAFAGAGDWFLEQPSPASLLFDSRVGAGAIGITKPVNNGFVLSEFVCHAGDFMIQVQEYSATSPNAGEAEALLFKQYEAIAAAPLILPQR
jgi:hypothetical protein